VPVAALNTALAEVLGDDAATPASPEGLAERLAERGARSSVPWIFNLLANELEYDSGRVRLCSLPPEVHLSLTSGCNIECGFCSYTHEGALFDAVSLDAIETLGFLGSLHTLRLSSGLGEPTMVRDLPRIVRHLERAHPHLRLNFFSNGLALGREELVDALVGRVTWINVSLNAATRETWRDVCGTDGFDRLCGSVAALRDAKRATGNVHPLLYGSAVVTRRVVAELPRLPALCRRLGIDRLTLIPFFAFEFEHIGKLGPEDTLDACRPQYDRVYDSILAEADRHRVSIELPLPAPHRRADFGLERRGYHDFARIGHEEPLLVGRLVKGLFQPEAPNPLCHWLWRLALIGRVDRRHVGRARSSHFLYPCLGPLVAVDFSDRTAFHFSEASGLADAWNHHVFTFLRTAQKRHGDSRVCDLCRVGDTREPARFPAIREALGQWSPSVPQVTGPISR
jgi:MoaA/NifB/PqqE/SkfB family radical SAM enzyme